MLDFSTALLQVRYFCRDAPWRVSTLLRGLKP